MSDTDKKSPWARTWGLAKKALFQVDAERVHEGVLSGLAAKSKVGSCTPKHELPVELMGLTFTNPLGVAAGLDKNGVAVPALAGMGFGFVEAGTVTWHPQPGNDKPRLFRLQDDEAIMNRMGFNNEGAVKLGERLAQWRKDDRIHVPVGVNLGKSKITPNEDAADDYRQSFAATADVADYMVVNISSPNTPGLRDLQTGDAVKELLTTIADANAKRATPRPLLLKLAPDLADEDAHVCAQAALDSGAQGLIVSNTTISREGLKGPVPEGSGGISGRPLFDRSTALLASLSSSFKGKLVFIGVGGIFDADDARKKREAGADLVQAYTGFIYGGPSFANDVVTGLNGAW